MAKKANELFANEMKKKFRENREWDGKRIEAEQRQLEENKNTLTENDKNLENWLTAAAGASGFSGVSGFSGQSVHAGV